MAFNYRNPRPELRLVVALATNGRAVIAPPAISTAPPDIPAGTSEKPAGAITVNPRYILPWRHVRRWLQHSETTWCFLSEGTGTRDGRADQS